VSIEQASIYLKEASFNDAKKVVQKDRNSFKQVVKQIDLTNDKQIAQ